MQFADDPLVAHTDLTYISKAAVHFALRKMFGKFWGKHSRRSDIFLQLQMLSLKLYMAGRSLLLSYAKFFYFSLLIWLVLIINSKYISQASPHLNISDAAILKK